MNFLIFFLLTPKLLELLKPELKDVPLSRVSLNDYSFLYANSLTHAGSVGIYISNTISFTIIGKIN